MPLSLHASSFAVSSGEQWTTLRVPQTSFPKPPKDSLEIEQSITHTPLSSRTATRISAENSLCGAHRLRACGDEEVGTRGNARDVTLETDGFINADGGPVSRLQLEATAHRTDIKPELNQPGVID